MINIFKLPVDGKGVESDTARSSNDWYEFKKYHKEHNPIRYFLNNEFEAMFIWPWSMRLERLAEWVRYRTTRRYHIINTGMKPGYADASERMLHVNFNMLKDFVEIEKAHMWTWHEEKGVPSKQPGVSHLVWEMGLENEVNNQAKNAREQYELYDWWTNNREHRIDPYETKEHTAYWDRSMELSGDGHWLIGTEKHPDLAKLQKKAHAMVNKLEKGYAKEDEKMLIRLMKIRGSLWT